LKWKNKNYSLLVPTVTKYIQKCVGIFVDILEYQLFLLKLKFWFVNAYFL